MKDIDTYYHHAKFHVNTSNRWLNVGKMLKKVNCPSFTQIPYLKIGLLYSFYYMLILTTAYDFHLVFHIIYRSKINQFAKNAKLKILRNSPFCKKKTLIAPQYCPEISHDPPYGPRQQKTHAPQTSTQLFYSLKRLQIFMKCEKLNFVHISIRSTQSAPH